MEEGKRDLQDIGLKNFQYYFLIFKNLKQYFLTVVIFKHILMKHLQVTTKTKLRGKKHRQVLLDQRKQRNALVVELFLPFQFENVGFAITFLLPRVW
jgi:hypothetical protein